MPMPYLGSSRGPSAGLDTGQQLDPTDGALATPQHQPLTMQQIFRCRPPVFVCYALIVRISPTLSDGASRSRLAADQPAPGEQFVNRRQLAIDDLVGLDGGVGSLAQCSRQGRRCKGGQVAIAEQCPSGRLSAQPLVVSVDEIGELLGQSPLGCPLMRPLLRCHEQVSNLLARLEAEGVQQVLHISIIRVQPELEEVIRAGQCGVQPDGACLGLAELGAIGLGQQGSGQRVHRGLLCSSNEIHASGDVAPLV